jgi:polyvinyl alcohol dehydrogenase (cytochrome)
VIGVSGPGGRRAGRSAALLVVVALVATGCSGDDGGDDDGVEVGVDPASDATTEAGCDWPMWGREPSRTFAQTCDSDLSTATVGGLELDWSFTTEDVVTASVAVHDGTVYAGDWSGAVYALDDASGEERWRFQTDVHDRVYSGQIVSSPAVAEVEGETALFVAGGKTMYRLDADTGEERWRFDVSFFDRSDDLGTNDDVPDGERPTEIQSSPVVVDGMVVFGFDAHDIPGYRAGVVALDAVTGDVVWYFDPDAGGEPTGCGGVWGSPSVDVEARQVFFGTANCPSSPAGWGEHTEAIVAVDLDSGEHRWSFQPHEPNNDDLDFAGAPNLFEIDGRAVVGLGNKDGTYYVVDRSTGELVWEQEAKASVYEPGRNYSFGGFIGPTAVIDGLVVGGTAGQGADACPCNHGLDAATGEVLWQTREALPMYGGTAAVNDLAFNGGIDFLVRAVDLATGETVWSHDVPGVVAGAPAIVGDSVYAVVGLREPGTETTAEQAGVFKFSLGEGGPGTDTTTTTQPAHDGPVVLADNEGRCIGTPCEVTFDFPTPPDGLTPTGTLLVTTDPFTFRMEAEGLGDPDQWVAPNAPNADQGAEVFVVALAVSVEQPFGAIICTFDAAGVCEADTIGRVSPSYERYAVLALPAGGAFPTVAEGAARLVYTATFEPPLVVVSPEPTE